MILQALVKHYEKLLEEVKVPKKGWCQAKVSYGINLSKEGEIIGIIFFKREEQRGKKKVDVPISLMVPNMVTRSSGVSANFLCDNSKYLLGIDVNGFNKRTLDCFQAAKEKHLQLLKKTVGDMAQAVCNYFEKWNPEKASENDIIKDRWDELTDGGNIIFCMGSDYAQDDGEIKERWDECAEDSDDVQEGICLVTGEKTEISRIHKTIKGVPGAQSSGAALVSFNAPAFNSYGKEQSYNAPVGKYAEFAYTTALNYLLSQRDYTFQLGDSMVVFWAESGKEAYQNVFSFSISAQPDNEEELKVLFRNLREQKRIQTDTLNLDPDQKFYILALAPNAARLSVRFFYQNSFGNILDNISKHYDRINVIRPVWEEREYLGIRDLLYETVNQKSKDKTPIPNMAAMTLQAVLANRRYPASLYTNTIIRIRAEQGNITWGRAGIIKAYLIQNYKWKEGDTYMALNEECKDVSYLLGRLFSVLESIQLDANPGIKATIRDRYFNSACTTPASIFPILIKLKNSHIKKLEREKAGAKIYYEKLLTKIMGKIEQFPKQLSLQQQGQFDLGYYHQVQKKYEKKEEK